MKTSLHVVNKTRFLSTVCLTALFLCGIASAQTIEVTVPTPVGIRADQGEARFHGLVGQVTIPSTGEYRINAKEWLNSGDAQRNESFFLNLKSSAGVTISPLDPNAGTEKVVPDIPGPASYHWRDCGLFALSAGTYAIWVHHYSVISNQYPQFLNEPISANPQSVRIVDSVLVTFVPPVHSNRAPLAVDDLINTLIDTPVSGQVLTNDADPDGDALSVLPAATVAPQHGRVLINTDGTFSYFPSKGYTGADKFGYEVCDSQTPALCDTATVWIQITSNTPANEKPVANDDVVETQVNVAIHANLLTNDFDPDGDPLTVTPAPTKLPEHGQVLLSADGSFVYTPAAGFTGEDAFVYTVCDKGTPALCDEATVFITVHPDTNGTRNDAPLAADDAFATLKNTPISGTLADNDQDPNGDPLIYEETPVKQPEHGTLVLNRNGTFTYTPSLDFVGADYFVYRVCDNQVPALCDQATVYITVLVPLPPPNHAPVAVDDTLETPAESPTSGNVLTNDSDPDGDPLVVTTTPVVAPEHGTLILQPDGTFTYTPAPGYAGIDSFVYQVCDTQVPPLCDQGTVHITVEPLPPPPNHAPVAKDDSVKTPSGQPAEGNVLTNDSDPDGDPLVVTTTPVVAPEHGTLILHPDGTFTYTPAPGYAGADSFVYQVCDTQVPPLCDQGTVHITVEPLPPPPNHAPVAVDDTLKTPAESPTSGNVLTNDSDPDGDPLVVTTTPVVAPEHGTLILQPDGTFTYSPAPGYAGVDSFVYQVCDTQVPPLCDHGTVHITVEPLPPPPNHAPVAVDDTLKTPAESPTSGNVLTNDSDPDGDPLVVTPTPVVAPEHGTLILQPDGTFTYTPAPGYAGADSFVYQVCDIQVPPLCDQGTVHITVGPLPPPPNHAPVANDDSIKTPSGQPAEGNVLTNDSDPDGDPLVVTTTPVVAPEHGTLILQPDGTFTYTPAPGYAGADSFVYQVCDNKLPPLCDQGTVHITVEPLPPPPNHPPMAKDDSVKTPSGQPAEGNVLTNDSDPDGDPLVVTPTPVVAPEHGTLILHPDGTFTYTPAPGYAGADSFVYQVCDTRVPPLCDQGTVHITVEPLPPPPNHAPVANDDSVKTPSGQPASGNVQTNDSDPDGDPLVVTPTPVVAPEHGTLILHPDGTFTYTPAPGYAGPDSFVYQVCDTRVPPLCDQGTVHITVEPLPPPPNHPPVATDDLANTLINTPVTGNVLTNDSDPDGDPLAVNTTPVVAPSHGQVALSSNGAFTYTPHAGYTGEDLFRYQVCDNQATSLCDTATVRIQILDNTPANQKPVANDDIVETLAGLSLYANLLVNDFDPDGNAITAATVPVAQPLHGTVTISANGEFVYRPAAGFAGADQFIYSICDNGTPSLCDEATVFITVHPDTNGTKNDPPLAADDAFATPKNTPFTGTLAANDHDPNGDALVYDSTPVNAPDHGVLSLQSDGTFTYTPAAEYTGPDHFVYRVCDNQTPALCDEATVYITVLPPVPPENNAPVAVDDSLQTLAGAPAAGSVLANDSDPDGDPLTVNPVPAVAPGHGALLLHPDGTFTYTPAPGYAGADTFVYQVCDNKLPPLCDQATVHITITAPPVPIPYIEALPAVVTIGEPIQVRVAVNHPVTAWDLWVYLADSQIDSTYGDVYVQQTTLTPGEWFRIDPDYLPVKLVTAAKQEMLKFEIHILDQYGNRARAETDVLVHEADDLSLDRNTYEPDLQEPLQIRFRLSSSRNATLDLYDIAGHHISELTDGVYPAGWTTYYWNGLTRQGVRVGSGVYIVTLRSDEYKDWKKFMIVR